MSVFGKLSHALNPKSVINEVVDIEAKKLNASYNSLTAEILNYEPSLDSVNTQWNKLSNIKKESNRNQFSHQNIKREILKKLLN